MLLFSIIVFIIIDTLEYGYRPSFTSNVLVQGNYIYNTGQHILCDQGGIYTLGVQPGIVITNNVMDIRTIILFITYFKKSIILHSRLIGHESLYHLITMFMTIHMVLHYYYYYSESHNHHFHSGNKLNMITIV